MIIALNLFFKNLFLYTDPKIMLQLEHLKTLCKALRGGGGGGSVIVDEYKENGVKIGRNLNSNCRPSSSERTLEIRVQASGIPKSFCKED